MSLTNKQYYTYFSICLRERIHNQDTTGINNVCLPLFKFIDLGYEEKYYIKCWDCLFHNGSDCSLPRNVIKKEIESFVDRYDPILNLKRILDEK